DRLIAQIHLADIGELPQVKNRTAYIKVVAEFMVESCPDEGFGLETEQTVVFKAHIDGNARIQDAFVENTNLAEVIIHAIITAFHERRSTGGNNDRTLWNIESIELNYRARLRHILTADEEFVLGCLFLCPESGTVVQFRIGIPFPRFFRIQHIDEFRPKRL